MRNNNCFRACFKKTADLVYPEMCPSFPLLFRGLPPNKAATDTKQNAINRTAVEMGFKNLVFFPKILRKPQKVQILRF